MARKTGVQSQVVSYQRSLWDFNNLISILLEGTHSVMVNVVQNGIGDPSSKSGQDEVVCVLLRTSILEKGMNPYLVRETRYR